MTPNDTTDPWESAYAQRGRIWGGAVYNLPPLNPSSRVLELGCGNGKTVSALLERGLSTVGIDIAPSAAALCKSQVRADRNSEVACADACRLPFAPASFDAVIAFHVFGHLTVYGRSKAAAEIARVLRPEGIFCFSGFSRNDFRAGGEREPEPWTFERKNGISTHYFSESEVRALFSPLFKGSCTTRHWSMTVRGQTYPRSEITACFLKNP